MTSETAQDNQSPENTQHDVFLQLLVSMANDSDMEIPMTLQISGMLVSGHLVSRKKYFDRFAEDFTRPFTDPESADTLRQTFSSMGGDVKSDVKSTDAEPSPLPNYVHMKGTQFFSAAGGPTPANSVWWRGRICEVGGFTLGTLAAVQT